jgi:hypothetical protein
MIDCGNGTKAQMCVKVAGNLIPNDRATGWTYDLQANAVFFDGSFVPPTSSEVDISYRVSTTGKELSCENLAK